MTARRRVGRFKTVGLTLRKLFSPNPERALTFPDDSLPAATRNAVERGNRRHRKMQKTVHRVPTQERILRRIALDMHRGGRRSEGPALRLTGAGLLPRIR